MRLTMLPPRNERKRVNTTAKKGKRRILKDIIIDRISAVDVPCNQHALVTIIKRAPNKETEMKTLSQIELEVTQLEQELAKASRIRPTTSEDDVEDTWSKP